MKKDVRALTFLYEQTYDLLNDVMLCPEREVLADC